MAPDARRRAEAILTRYEWEAARNATLQEGAVEVVARCRAAGFSVAILTRNARPTLDCVLDAFGIEVDAVRTREDGATKPSPEPVVAICAALEANPAQSWMVGDYLFDILSGQAAGARTILMIGDKDPPDFADRADHVIRRLPDLLPLIGIG